MKLKATGMRKVGPIAYLTQDSEFSFLYTSHDDLLTLLIPKSHRFDEDLASSSTTLALSLFFESLMINLTSCGDRLLEFATRSEKLFNRRDHL